MLVWWTNRSRLPSSGVMKPNPFSSLNHLTVPVGMGVSPPLLEVLLPRRCCFPQGLHLRIHRSTIKRFGLVGGQGSTAAGKNTSPGLPTEHRSSSDQMDDPLPVRPG